MQPGLFFFLLYHTNKAVKDFNVLLTLAVYDGAFSDFDVVNQFLNNFPVKLLHIQIAADDTGPLPDIFNLLLGFPLQDRYLYDYTFSNDNGQNPLMDKAHAYVENWKEAYKSNIGLLLFGDVGTGKSFFAGCIANALLDRDVPVLMTNFPTILNRLTGMFSEDRSEFIASFDEYDLLIIDDLGVERSTEYAMEQMFFVIDSRYRSRRPMIITTNLKLSELKNPPDLAHARIYDRILERCAPILFDGKNFREENAGATRQAAKDIVNSKHD